MVLESEEDDEMATSKVKLTESKAELKAAEEKSFLNEQDYLSQIKSQKRDFSSFSFVAKLGVLGLVLMIILSCAYFIFMMIDYQSLFNQSLNISGLMRVVTQHHAEMFKCLNAITLNQIGSISKIDGNSAADALRNCPESIILLSIMFKKVT